MKFAGKTESFLIGEDNQKNESRKIGSFTDAESGILINDCLYRVVNTI